ncbi:MAG: four helix bundle protein [Candidatus Methylomirabilales bacterium]
MDKAELERRTKAFALKVVAFVAGLSPDKVTHTLGTQLLKSGTSVGANYREANRAQSKSDFIHKIAIVEKEAAETQYWLELLSESNIGRPEDRRRLLEESPELLAIFTSIGKTSKFRRS